MAITDHVAILTHSSLAQATPNRKKAGNPLQFYGVFAFPPAAADDLKAALLAASPTKSLSGLQVRVPRNAQTARPLPGIPDDWFVIRAASGEQFPPYLADERGAQLDQPSQGAAIRTMFYPGKRVRVALSAYFWPNEGGGLSFNLNGVMAVSDGERLPIGNSAANAFAGYADSKAAESSPAQGDNPFGQVSQSGTAAAANVPTAGADPFQQSAKQTANSNPFA